MRINILLPPEVPWKLSTGIRKVPIFLSFTSIVFLLPFGIYGLQPSFTQQANARGEPPRHVRCAWSTGCPWRGRLQCVVGPRCAPAFRPAWTPLAPLPAPLQAPQGTSWTPTDAPQAPGAPHQPTRTGPPSAPPGAGPCPPGDRPMPSAASWAPLRPAPDADACRLGAARPLHWRPPAATARRAPDRTPASWPRLAPRHRPPSRGPPRDAAPTAPVRAVCCACAHARRERWPQTGPRGHGHAQAAPARHPRHHPRPAGPAVPARGAPARRATRHTPVAPSTRHGETPAWAWARPPGLPPPPCWRRGAVAARHHGPASPMTAYAGPRQARDPAALTRSPATPRPPRGAQRQPSAAAESRSAAEAVGSQLQGVVRPWCDKGVDPLSWVFCAGSPTATTPPRAFRQTGAVVQCACLLH
jgi:hypothetical protein